MKKTLILTLIILSFSNQMLGQRENQLNDMIISSLNSFIAESNRPMKGVTNRDTTHYYICRDGLPVFFPYDSMQNVTFVSLRNIEGLPNSFKRKLNNGIRILSVSTRLTDNQFIITVSNRHVRRTRRNHLSVETGFHVGFFTYEYCCEKQEWRLKEIEYR